MRTRTRTRRGRSPSSTTASSRTSRRCAPIWSRPGSVMSQRHRHRGGRASAGRCLPGRSDRGGPAGVHGRGLPETRGCVHPGRGACRRSLGCWWRPAGTRRWWSVSATVRCSWPAMSARSSRTPGTPSNWARTSSWSSPPTAPTSRPSPGPNPTSRRSGSTGIWPRPRRAVSRPSWRRRSSSSRPRWNAPCSGISTDRASCWTSSGWISQELRTIDKVYVVACGTAYHSGLVAKYVIEHWARLPVEVELASEFRYRDPVLGRRDVGRRDQPVR